ncbi:3-oxoacyl-reductase [Aspergillus insuetus]
MANFQGKVFTITGAASGIGYAIAHHLANLGARLSITDLSTKGLATTAAELENIIGKENLFSYDDDWDFTQDVNVKGMLNLVRAQLKYMTGAVERKEIETASVVVFGSNASVTGAPSLSAYTTSKHAVLGLMRAAAIDAAPFGVRVNAVCPGPIDTPMLRNVVSEERMKMLSSAIPLGRMGTAKEVVGLVQYLLDENSGFTTGAVHNVDGGITTA